MNRRFAAATEVSAERSRAEIESILRRAGATQFVSGWDEEDRAAVQFVIRKRMIRFVLPLPSRDSKEFTLTPERGLRRERGAADKAWEQACRSRWRALLLVIKAKIEAIEIGISTLESEFLAWMVTQDGQTIGERLIPELDRTLARGPMPLLLAGGAS